MLALVNENSSRSPYPQMGLAGAGLAGALVAVTLQTAGDDVRSSLEHFALGVPMAAAAAFFVWQGLSLQSKVAKTFAALLGTAASIVGDASCLLGFYYLFRTVSQSAAEVFAWAAAVPVLLVVFTFDEGVQWLDAYLAKRERAREKIPPS